MNQKTSLAIGELGDIRLEDRASFAQLYRTMAAPLVRYARDLLGDEQAAYDVLQDVFLGLWERRHTLAVKKSVRALLYVMTRNRALNVLRANARFAGGGEEALAGMGTSASVTETIDAEMLETKMRVWIGELPPRRSEAFCLSRFHDLTHAEIAEIMGVSRRTVDTHVVHALRYLRDKLEGLETKDT